MTSFALSQALFSQEPTHFKLRKNLSIQTSVSTKRGLSLVSSKDGSSMQSSKRTSLLKESGNEEVKKAKIKFFQCSSPTCALKNLPSEEELMELKPKKILSSNPRQRNTNLLSKGIMDSFTSTRDSFRGSKVERLWNLDSPVNKLL